MSAVSVASMVRQRVADDWVFAEGLQRGIVNLRAVARHLQAHGLDAPEDAVLSALRRLPAVIPAPAKALLDDGRVVVTHGVASLTIGGIIDAAQAARLIGELAPRWQVHSPQGMRLVVEENRLDAVAKRLLAAPDLRVRRGLAELALRLAPEARDTPGILALACHRLAQAGINVVETIDGFDQHTFLIAAGQAAAGADAIVSPPANH